MDVNPGRPVLLVTARDRGVVWLGAAELSSTAFTAAAPSFGSGIATVRWARRSLPAAAPAATAASMAGTSPATMAAG